MPERVVCLDTSVLVKYLTPDEQDAAASSLVEEALLEDARLVAPAFLWAEVGSVLRKKLRQRLLEPHEARSLWQAFLWLPIQYVDLPVLRGRAWDLADRYALATLYDAAFLACTEVVAADAGDSVDAEFWTADAVLLKRLEKEPLAYVRRLGGL
ncbi:MAG: type II toxin-antitoxin system VapC family toxin [Chloroflexi bacterium]|nr:type II toxin-antitoxin system VapC family toxin [Chloroflexota bacterium]